MQLRLTGRWQPGGWRSAGWSDWWAAAIQFAGTLLFNLSTFRAVFDAIADEVWRPDAFGSVAFLVASVLACHAVAIRDRLWDPTSRTWQVAWVNLAGSIAFGISAIGAYAAPGRGRGRRRGAREPRDVHRRAVLPRRRAPDDAAIRRRRAARPPGLSATPAPAAVPAAGGGSGAAVSAAPIGLLGQLRGAMSFEMLHGRRDERRAEHEADHPEEASAADRRDRARRAGSG